MNIRKFLGCRPRVGDKIAAGLDLGVYFKGVVMEDHSKNPDIPHYVASGTVYLSNMWKGVIEQEEDNIIIPANRARLI